MGRGEKSECVTEKVSQFQILSPLKTREASQAKFCRIQVIAHVVNSVEQHAKYERNHSLGEEDLLPSASVIDTFTNESV